jgi:hypothetical protein
MTRRNAKNQCCGSIVTESGSGSPETGSGSSIQINPYSDPDPIRIQGFDDQKLKEQIQLKFCLIFFGIKITIYLSLGLHKGRLSYRRSLQSSKENIQHFKKCNLFSSLCTGCEGYWRPIFKIVYCIGL